MTSTIAPSPSPWDKTFARIELLSMRGLEIGPLHNPRVNKSDSDVKYVDHASRDELIAKYADDEGFDELAPQIVETDFICNGSQTLKECVGAWGPVDYVVAGHVIEHVANPAGWLRQVYEVLKPGGVLSLVIPDKRYCFDARRDESTLAQLVDLDLRDVQLPTYQQIFDHFSNFMPGVSAQQLWDGLDPAPLWRTDVPSPYRYAFDKCMQVKQSGQYIDLHATTYTPASFAAIMGGLVELKLTDFEIADLFPTEAGSLEFFVTLRRSTLTDEVTRLQQQNDSIERALSTLASCAATASSAPPPQPSAEAFTTSSLEQSLIRAKREIMLVARQTRATARRMAKRPRR